MAVLRVGTVTDLIMWNSISNNNIHNVIITRYKC